MAELDLPEDLVADLERRPRAGRRRVITAAASAVLLVLVLALGLPWLAGASWPQILAELGRLPAGVIAAAIGLGLLALVLETLSLRAVVPGSRTARLLPAYAATSAMSIAIPGGALLGTGMLGWLLRRGGLGVSTIVLGLLAFSLGDLAVTALLVPGAGLVAYVVAGAQLDLPGTWAAALVAAAGGVLSLAAVAVVLSRPLVAAVAERLSPLVPAAAAAVDVRDALLVLLRRRGAALLAGQIGARLAHLLVLLLALRAVDADLSVAAAVAVFALGRVVAMVPLTPGGAGVTEAVGAASLIALGVPGADAAAAALVLMVSTVIVPVAAGALAAAAGALRSGGPGSQGPRPEGPGRQGPRSEGPAQSSSS
ncbi:lysylphosphatidylglycerol synthase domain-containing protein [Brachybacterium phenoliresistens]|uniref:lysylphosphatidylglycerol synthase domain-containing protein n=1 Tax=Brachybacterium phenoliresistens TaxID=396014 RepID=UPI0031CE4224